MLTRYQCYQEDEFKEMSDHTIQLRQKLNEKENNLNEEFFYDKNTVKNFNGIDSHLLQICLQERYSYYDYLSTNPNESKYQKYHAILYKDYMFKPIKQCMFIYNIKVKKRTDKLQEQKDFGWSTKIYLKCILFSLATYEYVKFKFAISLLPKTPSKNYIKPYKQYKEISVKIILETERHLRILAKNREAVHDFKCWITGYLKEYLLRQMDRDEIGSYVFPIMSNYLTRSEILVSPLLILSFYFALKDRYYVKQAIKSKCTCRSKIFERIVCTCKCNGYCFEELKNFHFFNKK